MNGVNVYHDEHNHNSAKEVTTVPQKFLIVGLNCIDIISVCDGYPEEDSDQRCLEQRWQRGGNASNTSSVLSILGAKVECMATVAESHEKGFITGDFEKFGVGYKHCVMHTNCTCPFSVAIINNKNGCRTILSSNSFRTLPELNYEDFKKLDLEAEGFTWIHFEGRRQVVSEICKMLIHISKYNDSVTDPKKKITTSVEVEKCTQNMEDLLDKADYTFVSKSYAHYKGYHNKQEAVRHISAKCKKGSTLICAWGDEGACATVNNQHSATNKTHHILNVPVHSPPHVVDTLGAGDTFNAATIYSLSHGYSLLRSLKFGCHVAGTKCGIQGLWNLKEYNLVP